MQTRRRVCGEPLMTCHESVVVLRMLCCDVLLVS